jgi:hypothetical protein
MVQLFVYSQLTDYANSVLAIDRARIGPSWGY